MAAPVYRIVFHEGHWRIKYEGMHLGVYQSAEKAAEAALRIAQSRLTPSARTRIINGPEGEMTIGDSEESL
jgi:hypothetical protein